MAETVCLSCEHFIKPGEHYHYAQTTYDEDRLCPIHRHDFAEVFYMLSGSAWHMINGRTDVLKAGALVFIRPEDAHGLRVGDGPGFEIANLAFRTEALNFAAERYFGGRTEFWGGQSPTPRQLSVEPERQAEVAAWFVKFAKRTRGRLDLEVFLLELLAGFPLPSDTANADPLATGPGWLRSACREIEKKTHFPGGVPEFVQLTGRSPEHVSRVLKKLTGQTPSQIVNRARLEYAAARLSERRQAIAEIAFDCGFQSLSQFYHLFRARFGVPPRQYRLRQATPLPLARSA